MLFWRDLYNGHKMTRWVVWLLEYAVRVTVCVITATGNMLYASSVSQTDSVGQNKKGKGSPYSFTEHRVPELIPVLGSQPAGDVSHIPGGRLPLLFPRPASYPHNQFRCLVNRGTMGVNSLPKTIIQQQRGCNLNPGPSAPESNTLTTWLLSHRGFNRLMH